MIKNKTFLCRNIPWAESAYHENLEEIYLRTYFNFYDFEEREFYPLNQRVKPSISEDLIFSVLAVSLQKMINISTF